MNLIAAVDKNWAIGKGNSLLVNIPEDRQFFREETKGKVLIMGRKTLESLPEGSPLMFRTNIVLTRDMNYKVKDAIVCHSIEEVLEEIKQYPTEDVFVIGGEEIYEQFIGLCDTAHITKVDYVYDADKHFPNLDKAEDWKMTESSEEKTYFNIIYEFVKYERK